MNEFLNAGIKHYRVELIDEKPDDAVKMLNRYKDLIDQRDAQAAENLLRFLDKLPNSQVGNGTAVVFTCNNVWCGVGAYPILICVAVLERTV
jgi:hypothetical protein